MEYLRQSSDFTSLYPNEAARNVLPYGKPIYKGEGNWSLYNTCTSEWDANQKSDSEFSTFFGFVRVSVRTINNEARPLHGIRQQLANVSEIFKMDQNDPL